MIDETVAEIREMQTHSSSIVAVKAARALETLLDREFATVEEYQRALERNSDALRRAAPSHASLWTTQRKIIQTVVDSGAETVAEAKTTTTTAIDAVVEQVESGKRAAAENAAALLDDGETVLTHDYSSTVVAALERAAEAGKSIAVIVTEARPRYLGRKSARRLSTVEGLSPSLIVDSAAGYYLPECDRVMVGMDCIVEERFYNRIGTYALAATAADVGVPMQAVGSSAKLVAGGFRFENEFRSSSEVIREPADGFDVLNPAYDATPTRLLDAVITDEGVKSY